MSAKRKILIVDDDPDVLLLLRVTLGVSFETILAGDGHAALRRIEAEQPDLVILDVMMPIMDGWGVLEGMLQQSRRVPVIVLTAKAGQMDMARAAEMGAAAYLTKPFAPEDLMAAIHSVLGGSDRDHAGSVPIS